VGLLGLDSRRLEADQGGIHIASFKLSIASCQRLNFSSGVMPVRVGMLLVEGRAGSRRSELTIEFDKVGKLWRRKTFSASFPLNPIVRNAG
jgi:hypothetical protein